MEFKAYLHDSQSKQQGTERRLVPRLLVSAAQFRVLSSGQLFSIYDLSSHGMGLQIQDERDLDSIVVGNSIQGVLNLMGEKHSVTIRVRNRSKLQAGCQFENLDDPVIAAIRRQLDPENLGSGFKLIPSLNLETLWYHGLLGTELLFKCQASDEKVLERPFWDPSRWMEMSLFMMGDLVQWSEAEGLSSGRICDSGLRPVHAGWSGGLFRWEWCEFELDASPSPEKLAIAKKLILSSNLSNELKGGCLQRFGSPS